MCRAICIALFMLFLSACSADRIVLSLHTSHVINPDEHHRALALYLKIFQLTSLESIQDQSVSTLWTMTKNKDVLSVDTVFVKNNDTKVVTIDLNPKAEFVAVVADFRQGDDRQKLIVPVEAEEESQISVLIHDNQIELGGSS